MHLLIQHTNLSATLGQIVGKVQVIIGGADRNHRDK